MRERLPKGWTQTTLGDITMPSRERGAPSEFPDMRYVGLEHIEAHTMKILGYAHGLDVRSSAIRFSKGDVLYGKMRPYLNKVWVAEFDGLCSAEFLVFPKRAELNNQFLAARLNAGDFSDFANAQVSGERPRVDFEKLSSFPILLPPLPEQGRIVAKLNAVASPLSRAEAAAGRARARIQGYSDAVLHAAVMGNLTRDWRRSRATPTDTVIDSGKALLRSLLAERRERSEKAEIKRLRAIGREPTGVQWKSRLPDPRSPEANPIKLPTSWTWASIDQISWHSGYGTSVKCTYESDGPAVLRIPNIRNRVVEFDDLKFARRFEKFRDEDFIAPGDLLLIRTNGSRDLIGRAAVVKGSPASKCTFASYLIRFRLVGDELVWSWISIAWQSDVLRSSIESRAVTTAGQYNVSLSRLADIAIPLPPRSELAELLREVERRLGRARELGHTLDRQLELSRTTRRSLVQQAFAGELVPQNHDDEPASAQIARIRAGRDAEGLRKVSRMPKSRAKRVPSRRPLLEVIREHGAPMTPEQLFAESGYLQEFEANESRQDVVDSFYEELRELIGPGGSIREERPDAKTVLLQAKQ